MRNLIGLTLPLISVVMSVRNNENSLSGTIDSILKQKHVNLEFIIVDDGSTDKTLEQLNKIASEDSRVRILPRSHRGLTLSLIEACRAAQGEFIARQDSNDISLDDRLYLQASALVANKSSSMCSSHVQFVTIEGAKVILNNGITNNSKTYRGIIHGSVMMRKKIYEQVGGYREQFYFAQDIDLWSRIIELGSHIVIPSILYQGMLFSSSISGSKRQEQERFAYYIQRAAAARENGESEETWLRRAESFSMKCRKIPSSSKNKSKGAYFIASCLEGTNLQLAKKYYAEALKYDPMHLRARIKLAKLKCP